MTSIKIKGLKVLFLANKAAIAMPTHFVTSHKPRKGRNDEVLFSKPGYTTIGTEFPKKDDFYKDPYRKSLKEQSQKISIDDPFKPSHNNNKTMYKKS